MKNLMVIGVALALAGQAHAYLGYSIESQTAKTSAGKRIVSNTVFADADKGAINTANWYLERAVPSTTKFAITGTPFVDQAWVIPFTALGIRQSDLVKVVVKTTNGSTTNFDYLGWFAAPDYGTQTASSMSNKQIIWGGARADQGNIVIFDWLAPSNKTGTLYVANGEAAAAINGANVLEVILFSRTNTR